MKIKLALSLLTLCMALTTVYVAAQSIAINEDTFLVQLKEAILACEKQHICNLTYRVDTGEATLNCVPKDMICDGNNDCFDGSDERYCAERCDDGETICRDTYTCNKVCDGIKQCDTAEDEMQCGRKCDHGYVLCNDQQTCAKTCDGISDCINGTDEEGCPTKCPSGRLLCQDKVTCAHACDGNTECPGDEDEMNCPFYCFCDPGEYACRNTNTCLPRTSICEGAGNTEMSSCGPLGDDEAGALAGTVCRANV